MSKDMVGTRLLEEHRGGDQTIFWSLEPNKKAMSSKLN